MSSFWSEFPRVYDDLAQVRRVILDAVQSTNTTVAGALTDYVLRPGKMLRPAFVVLAARAQLESGRRRKKYKIPTKFYRIAAAMEMLHIATLIHDDVIDDADTRRGEATLHKSHGVRNAVLMGDILFSRCFSLVVQDTTMENARLIAGGVSRILTGEIAQAETYDLDRLSVRDYLRRIIAKTALLFSACFHVGAAEAGGKEGIVAPLRRAGYNIGMGFQIMDDILDFRSSQSALGKPVGTDLAAGVVTLPVILALRAERSHSPAAAARRRQEPPRATPLRSQIGGSIVSPGVTTAEVASLRGLIADYDGNTKQAMALIDHYNGFTKAATWAGYYTNRARREIARLPAGSARSTLEAVTEKLLNRDY